MACAFLSTGSVHPVGVIPAGAEIVTAGTTVSHSGLVSAGMVGRYRQKPDGKRLFTSIYRRRREIIKAEEQTITIISFSALSDLAGCE